MNSNSGTRTALPPPEISIIVRGGTVLAGPDQQAKQGLSLVLRGGKIEFIGEEAEAQRQAPGAQVLSAEGATVLPGLTDAHAHLETLARYMATVQLAGTSSLDEVIDRIAKGAESLPSGAWVIARGWDQNKWPQQEFPNKAALDARVPDHPVAATRIDGHALYVNSIALRAAGIDRNTPDPPGGRIIRDAHGEPTGVLVDDAVEMVTSTIPRVDRQIRKKRLRAALQVIVASGLTEIHEAAVEPAVISDETIDIYKELIDTGQMPIRINFMLSRKQPSLGEWFKRGPLVGYGGKLTVRSVKVYADGALGSRGAALLAPYSDEAGNTGILTTDGDNLTAISVEAREHGFQIATHAIGDRGCRLVIDSYERAGVQPADRFRIEHLQVISLDDIPRLARDGIIASMQPAHATSDMPWAERRLGPDRIRGAYAWRKVLNAGGHLAFGSDFPIESVNPFYGIYSAVTRQDQAGNPPGGWKPEEKLTLPEAISAFTKGAAYAAFEEGSRGTIEVGKNADLTIVEGDLMKAPPSELFKTKVRMTIVDGKVVYDSGSK
ncbi:MAG TPA: amidohydrolase [Thermoanaerobaculia bacterium]|nr:amidohydrolase [Thermoanaerobaculia bacterium]